MAETTRTSRTPAEAAARDLAVQVPFPRARRALDAGRAWVAANASALIDLAAIGLWAAWLGRAFLDLDPRLIPAGREFSSAVQSHHLWTQLARCGWCALWNGSVRGGAPAFVDVHGSLLHPLVALTTLLWGVIPGAKLALVAAFWAAGAAQWWLARELGIGRAAGLWSALIAVAGGHLSSRMELGALGVVLSTAMSSLTFPAALAVWRRGTRRSAVLLGIATASAIVSGQGYIQVGMLFTLPAFAFLLLNERLQLSPVWRQYALAAGLALLLAAPFLVPLANFYPNFVKDSDPAFKSAQALEYLPLNLVIRDLGFLRSEALGKLPYPHLYGLYIGWIPVLLAFTGLAMGRREDRRWQGFMAGVIVLEFLVASSFVLRWLLPLVPGVAGVRHPPQIAGLAVPPILALAAFGLDRLLKLDWPSLLMKPSTPSEPLDRLFSFQWVLIVPLVLSLRSTFEFSRSWLYTQRQGDGVWLLLEGLRTPDLQWVNPPFGEHFYIEPAVGLGLKLSPGIRTWNWEGTEFPIPALEANRAGPPPGPVRQVNTLDGVPIYARDDQPYAAIDTGSGLVKCSALGSGGRLEVTCDSPLSGRLVVKENAWSGWYAWRDGRRTPLLDGRWLAAEAPAGEHVFVFRYLPWDVPLGMGLMLAGVVLCVRLWRRDH